MPSAAYWHKAFPYKSSLTEISSAELADGYEKAPAAAMWTRQLGATLALFDAGRRAPASGDPKTKASVAKAMSTLKTVTIDGPIDFTPGPVPNVSPGRSSARNG